MGSVADKIISLSPALYWKLDDVSGNAQDSSGNARHADSNLTLTYREAGVGSPLSGGDELYSILDNAPGDMMRRSSVVGLNALTDWTVMSWVKKTDDVDGLFWLVGRPVFVGNGWYLQYDATTNKLVAKSGFVGNVACETNAGINIGQWYHVAVVRTAAPLWKMYLNGVLQTTQDIDAMTAPATEVSLYQESGGAVLQGNGNLAHFAIFQSIISDADILNIALGSPALPCGGVAGWMSAVMG